MACDRKAGSYRPAAEELRESLGPVWVARQSISKDGRQEAEKRAWTAGRFLAEQGTTEFEQHPHNICQGLWGERLRVWLHLPLARYLARCRATLEDLWRARTFPHRDRRRTWGKPPADLQHTGQVIAKLTILYRNAVVKTFNRWIGNL